MSLVSPRTSIHMRLSVAVSRSAGGRRSSSKVPCGKKIPNGFYGLSLGVTQSELQVSPV